MGGWGWACTSRLEPTVKKAPSGAFFVFACVGPSPFDRLNANPGLRYPCDKPVRRTGFEPLWRKGKPEALAGSG